MAKQKAVTMTITPPLSVSVTVKSGGLCPGVSDADADAEGTTDEDAADIACECPAKVQRSKDEVGGVQKVLSIIVSSEAQEPVPFAPGTIYAVACQGCLDSQVGIEE